MIESIQARLRQSKMARLLVKTFLKWQQDECVNMGATLAYYALFSLFPLILVILSIFGYFVGPSSNTYNSILVFAQEALPTQAYGIVEQTLLKLNQSSPGASIIGFLLLLLVASGYFSVLDHSFDKIWADRQPKKNTGKLKAVAIAYVRRKTLSFMLILGAVLLLLLSQITNIVILIILRILRGIDNHIDVAQMDMATTLDSLQLVSSFLLLLIVVMTLFKILPPVSLRWRDVWGGALLTSTLLILLQQLVSSSMITIGRQFQAYGVVGGVMVLLLWIYLANQILLLGGEFTCVYTQMFGKDRNRRSIKVNSSIPE